MSSTARSPIVVAFKTLLIVAAAVALGSADDSRRAPTQFNEFTVAQLQDAMNDGRLTSERLTQYYIDRIFALDQNGPGVNSVIELNPDAIELAERADAMRRVRSDHREVPAPRHSCAPEGQRRYRRQDADDRRIVRAGWRARGPGLDGGRQSCAPQAPSFWARRTCPSGRTSARHIRAAAGRGAAASRTIPTRSIATRADPVRDRARRRPPTLRRSRSAVKPTAASSVREASTASRASSRRLEW